MKKIDGFSISFGIAPRINACGRMGFAEEALELFLTNDYNKADEIGDALNKYNIKRQDIEKRIYKEVLEELQKEDIEKLKAIVVAKENWHHGVIGIVSSKITELYYKPSILLCIEGEEAKGSGRSVEGIDLYKALVSCNKNLNKYGGHEMAVRINIEKRKI